jgi:hypothetical protein
MKLFAIDMRSGIGQFALFFSIFAPLLYRNAAS